MGSCWEEKDYIRLPKDRVRRFYAPGNFYATDALADYALDFIRQGGQAMNHPWFLYLAFNAPHFPLHAPRDVTEKYAQVYARGWDVIRGERLDRMKRLGLAPRET